MDISKLLVDWVFRVWGMLNNTLEIQVILGVSYTSKILVFYRLSYTSDSQVIYQEIDLDISVCAKLI